MNYALFAKWVQDRADELVSLGVPRVDADSLMCEVERGAIAAEAVARSEDQFLLDLRRIGVTEMAHRKNKSRQAIHQQKTNINQRLSARLTTG